MVIMKRVLSAHKSVLAGIMLLLCLAGALACFSAVKAAGYFGLRLDMTDNRMYEISQQTKAYLSGLKTNVHITVLAAKESYFPIAAQMLDRCEKSSEFLTVEYADPYVNPLALQALRAGGLEAQENDLVVQAAGDRQVVLYSALFTTDAQGETVETVRVEQAVVSAINRLLYPQEKSVVFTQGHNEEQARSLQDIFTASGFRVEQKSLQIQDISDTTRLVVIASPSIDFTPQEIVSLRQFTQGGGSILAFWGDETDLLPNLAAWCAEWGLSPGGGVVLDTALSIGGNPTNTVGLFTNHEINQRFEDDRVVPVLPVCRPIDETAYPVKGMRISPIIVAGANAIVSGGNAGKSPVWMAALAEREDGAALFLAGSGQMLGDDLLGYAAYANAALLRQSIVYLCPDTDVVHIPEKQVAVPRIAVLPHQTAAIFAGMAAVAGVLILSGAVVVAARRHRQ